MRIPSRATCRGCDVAELRPDHGSQRWCRPCGRFFYSGPAPAEIRAPRRGAPYFQLEFGDGDVTGIAATARLDRFRSRGVNMGQFGEDTW